MMPKSKKLLKKQNHTQQKGGQHMSRIQKLPEGAPMAKKGTT